MRILALTDIHHAYDTLESIIANESSADVILLGGDMTTNGTEAAMRRALAIAVASGKRVLAVCGNMDPPSFEKILEEHKVSTNAKGVVIGEFGFFGVSGAPLSFLHTPYEISEEEIADRAEAGWKEVADARWKIFVPHAPPSQTNVDKTFIGKHVGSTAVRSFIERRQPDVVVCGHIHEARGQDVIGRSRIVNCGAAANGYYAIIEMQKEISINNQQLTMNCEK